jgi:acyl-CoA dehydrogenase
VRLSEARLALPARARKPRPGIRNNGGRQGPVGGPWVAMTGRAVPAVPAAAPADSLSSLRSGVPAVPAAAPADSLSSLRSGVPAVPAAAPADSLSSLRSGVRAFVAEHGPGRCDSWLRDFDPAFSRELGRRGWIGLTVPHAYGGHEAGHLARYVVTEELLAAGAPVAYHWFADRQVAPTLVAHGSDRLRDELLPRICRGELCVCIGISEPGAGSDVAAISTRAVPADDGWRVSGQKVWTTGAMHAQYCYLVVRTGRGEARHDGLSELVVPMDRPGISVRPIEDLAGEAHFAEIFFDEVFVEDWRLVGTPGEGFRQIVRQLDYERSGPERFLSTMPLLDALLVVLRRTGSDAWLAPIGELAARLAGLRALALDVAAQMDRGAPPAAAAALVKDLGAQFEQDVVTLAVEVADSIRGCGGEHPNDAFAARLREGLLYQSTFTLRGGTIEILREVVARRLLRLPRSG